MTHIRVQVTQADIDAGLAAVSDSCPLALALRRTYPDARVTIGRWWMPSGKGTFALSSPAFEFVLNVDRGAPVQPATFVLEGPAQ